MPRDNSSFRLNAKTLFLTYPRCPLDKNVVLTILRGLVSPLVVESYVIGRERHAESAAVGESAFHIHCYIALSGKVNYRNSGRLDLLDGTIRYHGNYQGAKNPREVIQYCKKDGDFIEFGHDVQEGRRSIGEIMATSSSREEFFGSLRSDHPEFLLRSYNGVKSFAADNFREVAAPFVSPYEVSSFDVGQVLLDWVQHNIVNSPYRPRSLVLLGASWTGKTSWARSLGRHVYFQRGLNWNKWDDEAKYVVVDDVDWEFLNKSGYKKVLLGGQREYEVRQAYKPPTTIKGGIPCIYITNDMPNLDSWDRVNVLVVDIGEVPLYRR